MNRVKSGSNWVDISRQAKAELPRNVELVMSDGYQFIEKVERVDRLDVVFANTLGNGRWFDTYIQNLSIPGVLGILGVGTS